MDANNLQVRWKHHQIGVMDYLRQLLISEVFVDVTLCCQNKSFKAHRILLSACSSYLQKVLVEHLASDHVTIILPDVHPDDMQWLLDFMYTGSVAVPRCRLSSFLQAAEALDIKVLTDIAQKQKAADSDSVVCIPAGSPALDIKLTKHTNFQNDFINPNTDSYYINPYNLTEDFKHSACKDDAKIPSESSGLAKDKQEFKSVTDSKKSCVFKCSMENLCYVPSGAQSPLENKDLCKVTLNASSSYDNLSKRTETHEGTQGQGRVEGKDSSSKGVAAVNSGCNTKIIHSSVDGNKTSVRHSSENAVLPYLEEPLHNNLPYNKQLVTGNLQTNHNPTPSSANNTGKSVNLPQANTGSSNDTVTLSEEYGLKLSSCSDLHTTSIGNDKRITSNSTDPKYGQDVRVTEELPLRDAHRNCEFGSAEHCTQYSQRLSQWPKPLPSLMPISNNNPHYNGQIPSGYLSKDNRINGVVAHKTRRIDRKDTLPQHFQNMKNVIPNNESEYQSSNMAASGILLTEHRCVRSMWLSGRGKLMHLSGHRPTSDCRPSGRLPQIVPRLSPIVPPSPWVQHHRPPCATPVTFPPRGGPIGFNYQPGNWITSKQILSPVPTFVSHVSGYPQTPPLLMPPEHQSSLGDITRLNSFTQAPIVNPRGNTVRSPSPHTACLKRSENNRNHMECDQAAPGPNRASESIDVFCRLKERRLQEFYREQMTKKLRTDGKESQNREEEAASDLSTKSSQSPARSPHSSSARSSPSDYHKMTSPSTVSLQQKLKILSESSSPKLSTCDEMLTCKETVRKDGNTTIKRNCDSDGNSIEMKTEQVTSVLMDDTKSQLTQLTVTKHSEHEQNHESREYDQENCDMQALNDAKRKTFMNNDSNNNNRDNGMLDECAQSTPIAKSHGCEDCGKCFSRRQLLVQHRRIHTGERPYSCADCGRQFTQRGHWSTHQKLHEPARRPEHACPSCGKAFVTRASLKVHLRTHTGEKPFQCGECGKQFSQLRNYKYHRSVHEGTREFAATCPECGKYFNDRGYLSSHMKIHRNRKEYGCQYCGKSFNQRVAYNMHVRIHTGERPHSCPHCNKSFSRKMLLKQHLRIHTGEKPFACSVCGKAFADRSNMTLHMRLHSGIKPYSCQLCAKAFTKKHHLKTHLNYHTGTKPYSCSKCGLRFSQSSNMRTHYKKCTSTGLANPETAVSKTESTAAPGTENNSAMSPSSSPGRMEVTVTSPRSPSTVITPPHSDESSCASSVISRNAIEVQPA